MRTLPVVVQQPSTYVYPSVELGFGTEIVDRHVGFKGIRTDVVPLESCFPYGVSEILITQVSRFVVEFGLPAQLPVIPLDQPSPESAADSEICVEYGI